MKTLYFDCFSGISGDMVLGAMIDCGVDVDAFKSELEKLNLDGYRLEIKRSVKNSISGIDVDVILEDHGHNDDHESHEESVHEHQHHDGCDEGCHEHHHEGHDDHHHLHSGHGEFHQEEHIHEHNHRNLSDIEGIIDNSGLNSRVKDMSKQIFRRLAAAEAKIHGKPVEEVHFHEVGAVDSIVDIVGTAICVDLLGIEKFEASPLNTGMGFVKCQHGIIPVPGPAAVELLKGVPIYSLDINTELVTPTGAAIVSTLCQSFGPIPQMTVESTGYGCGKKELTIPNLLRVIVGSEKKKSDSVYVLECNIDDMNSEFYEHVMDRLFKMGALDVFLSSIMMKKGRPAVKLSVLSKPEDVEKLSGIIFNETSTIGIRRYLAEREVLERKILEVKCRYGVIRVKEAYHDNKAVNHAPEYEDVKSAALLYGVSIKDVYNEVMKEYTVGSPNK